MSMGCVKLGAGDAPSTDEVERLDALACGDLDNTLPNLEFRGLSENVNS
jgi:hypothetical protein